MDDKYYVWSSKATLLTIIKDFISIKWRDFKNPPLKIHITSDMNARQVGEKIRKAIDEERSGK